MLLLTNKNYNALQATRPWAPSEDVATFNRSRDGSRGRGQRPRDQGRPGNDWNPRNEQYNSGGKEFNSPGQGRGRGQPNCLFQQQRGNFNNNAPHNFNNLNNNNANRGGGSSGSNNSNFQQKSRPPNNKNFRGGGN
jgi:hypothetical protein